MCECCNTQPFSLKTGTPRWSTPCQLCSWVSWIIISVLCADTNITLSDDTWQCCVLLIMKLDAPWIAQPWGMLSNMLSIHSLTHGTYTMTSITRNLQLELFEHNPWQWRTGQWFHLGLLAACCWLPGHLIPSRIFRPGPEIQQIYRHTNLWNAKWCRVLQIEQNINPICNSSWLNQVSYSDELLNGSILDCHLHVAHYLLGMVTCCCVIGDLVTHWLPA